MTTIDECVRAASKYTGVSVKDMRSRFRHRKRAQARWLAMWLAHKTTGRPYGVIGRLVGNRERTTVMHGVRQVDRLMAEDPLYRQQVCELLERLRDKENAPNRLTN